MVPHTGGTGYRTPFPHPIIPRTFPLQGDPTLAVLNLSPLGIHAYRGPSQSLQKPFSLITVSNPRMFSLRISRKGPLGKRDTVYSRPFPLQYPIQKPFLDYIPFGNPHIKGAVCRSPCPTLVVPFGGSLKGPPKLY